MYVWVEGIRYQGHRRYFEQNAKTFELQQTISSNEVSDAVDTVETAPDLDNMPSSLKEGIEPPLCDDVPTNEGDNKTKNYGVRFTVQQAVIKMFQLSEENLYWDSFEQEFTLFEVPQACELAMLEDVKRQKELVTFMGYEYVNPFNVKGNHQATFPREAFYEWWKANPHGIPCPEWFEDFLERDNPSPSLSLDDEEAPRSVQSGSGVGLDRFGGAVQFGRLTLRILELIQEWLEKPDAEKGEESKWRESLFRFIDCTARKEGWGQAPAKDKERGLSETQWGGIQAIFLPAPDKAGCDSKSWGGNPFKIKDLKANIK